MLIRLIDMLHTYGGVFPGIEVIGGSQRNIQSGVLLSFGIPFEFPNTGTARHIIGGAGSISARLSLVYQPNNQVTHNISHHTTQSTKPLKMSVYVAELSRDLCRESTIFLSSLWDEKTSPLVSLTPLSPPENSARGDLFSLSDICACKDEDCLALVNLLDARFDYSTDPDAEGRTRFDVL